MARKLRDEFDALARPSALDDVMREDDFLTRAEKLFSLRERLWEAYDSRAREIHTKTMNRPGKIGAALGFALFAAAGIGIAGFGIFGLAVAAVLGFGGGALGYVVADNPKQGAPKSLKALATQNFEAQRRIDSCVDDMKGKVLIQGIVVKDQFRKAARADKLREDERHDRVIAARMKQAEAAPAPGDDLLMATGPSPLQTVVWMNLTMMNMNIK